MTPDLDYAIAADRIGHSLAAKRSSAIGYLRGRGKYLGDPGTAWSPTRAVETDIAETMERARQADMLVAIEQARAPA